ncbi:MAG: glycosyltransferase family 1 protein [Chloroflexi bacterium]|nr:MAG: glycosyltransferase family 1 protein [Chloroflexota bacterium]
MHVAINAWFWNQPATGSGQYVRRLLASLEEIEPEHRFYPIMPRSAVRRKPSAAFYKLWFEQVVFPRAAAARKAEIALVPYFASPLQPTTPTVVTVHDLIPIVLPAYRGSALVRAYTRLVAAGARRADAVIADSEHSKRDIVTHLRIDPQQVFVIPLAVGPEFRPAPAESVAQVRRQYSLPPRYVLYLGGFDQRKNVGTLLRAFAELRTGALRGSDLRLVVAGRLPARDTSFAPDPQRLASELGIEDAVIFPGWIEEDDKPALYTGAELFVFPSRYEGFGLPVLEAMACGTPVVTSNTSSLPEIVGDAGLTLDPNDASTLAEGMWQVLRDPDRRQAMREAGLRQAGRFSWHRTARATLDVLVQKQVPGQHRTLPAAGPTCSQPSYNLQPLTAARKEEKGKHERPG